MSTSEHGPTIGNGLGSDTDSEVGAPGEAAPRAAGASELPHVLRHRIGPVHAGRTLLPESWRIQLPIFEGPLDLLLQLIRINEVDLSDIPVALVCDQFHEYLSLMEELDLDIAGEFIYEAALLIQLKSRMLLPQPDVAEGGESTEDPREELVRRLLDYRRLREAAHALAEVDSVRSGLWTRRWQPIAPDPEEEGQLDLSEVSLFDLLRVLRDVLQRFDAEHPEPLYYRGEAFTVRGQIERLLGRLQPGRAFDLIDDLLGLSCRAEAVAAFLAVLEMTRLSLVRLHQGDDRQILLYRTTRELLAHELETIGG